MKRRQIESMEKKYWTFSWKRMRTWMIMTSPFEEAKEKLKRK